jgi:hypothetical protein
MFSVTLDGPSSRQQKNAARPRAAPARSVLVGHLRSALVGHLRSVLVGHLRSVLVGRLRSVLVGHLRKWQCDGNADSSAPRPD